MAQGPCGKWSRSIASSFAEGSNKVSEPDARVPPATAGETRARCEPIRSHCALSYWYLEIVNPIRFPNLFGYCFRAFG